MTKRISEDELPPIAPLPDRDAGAGEALPLTKDRLREKEKMADFIAKKREMFLVQMALDTKRDGIRKVS